MRTFANVAIVPWRARSTTGRIRNDHNLVEILVKLQTAFSPFGFFGRLWQVFDLSLLGRLLAYLYPVSILHRNAAHEAIYPI